ncbi:hypothetical protein DL771_001391 [Monosporascus sp. 5C6A]|nr:hypothetical protein DL771_001391 [Monosporascus sp. 5C6A]
MGDIFRSANLVFVSLGPILRGRNRFWALLQSFVSRGDFASEEFEDELDEFMEGVSNDLAMGFDDLIQRPWFRRAWTYQEIRLATAAVVICGDSFMPWNSFVESLDAFNRTGAFLSRFSALRTFLKEQAFMLKVPSALEAAEPKLESSISPRPRLSKEPLLDLLVDGWPRDASDPRDKIYAFTSSHLTSTPYAELRPDYALDMRSTFIRLIRVYINNENNLNFLRFARGISEPVHLPETGVIGTRLRWVSVPNLERTPLPEHIRLNTPADTSGNWVDPSKFSQTEALPSWICDWRVQGLRAKVDAPPFLANEHYFDVRRNVSPPRQSIHDFDKRLVFKGCALARAGHPQSKAATTSGGIPLGTFSSLPRCALQKALVQSSGRTSQGKASSIPRQSQLFDHDVISGDKNPPSSNIVVLLLQTLLHDQINCDCDVYDNLEARCPYYMYPRSYVCNLDWLFLLDGLAEPVILRPHITPGIADTSRSKIGFDFVSRPKAFLKQAKPKQKKEQKLETADDYQAAGVDFEEAAGKWRAGDAAKSMRFFRRAINVYGEGLQKFPDNFDLAYNKARVQLEIATHPVLVEELEEPVLEALQIALESHRYALQLDPDDANTLFNTSQALASIAESIANDEYPQQALQLLEEAIGLQSKCLDIQEAQYSESLKLERMAEEEMRQENPSQAVDVPRDGSEAATSDSDEQWATVVEPVTQDTLIDTALAQLSALTTFCDVLSSNPESALASTLSGVEKHWSGLEHKLGILSTNNPERSQEIVLNRAKFVSALLEGGFRFGRIDGDSYKKGRDSAFAEENVQLETSAEALIANARSLMAFNSAIADTKPNDQHLSTLRWNALAASISNLNAASKIQGTDQQEIASTHLLRGDASVSLYTMGTPPTSHQSAIAQATQLLKNAEVYYRNAGKLSQDREVKDIAAFRCQVASGLQGQLSMEAVDAILAGNPRGREWATEQLEDMMGEGGLLPAFPSLS